MLAVRGSSNDWMASSTPSIWTGWRSLRSSSDSGPETEAAAPMAGESPAKTSSMATAPWPRTCAVPRTRNVATPNSRS